MAQIIPGADNLSLLTLFDWLAASSGGPNPMFGVRVQGGGTTSAFTTFYLNTGTTTVYFWLNSAATHLRFGTTEPTTATQNTAGSQAF